HQHLSLNDPAPTQTYPLSLHDALPICAGLEQRRDELQEQHRLAVARAPADAEGRKMVNLPRSKLACLPAPSPCLPKRSIKYMGRSEEHTSELQSRSDLVCRLLLEKKND